MMSLQSIIWVFLLNNFSRVINLLLTKIARDRTGRILAPGLFCMDLAALGPYCQDLGPMFSQYGPRAWLIRYIYRPDDSPLSSFEEVLTITNYIQALMLLKQADYNFGDLNCDCMF